MTRWYSSCVTYVHAQVKRLGDPHAVLRPLARQMLLVPLVIAMVPFNSSSISSLGEPISNSPGGMSTSFMPMELVISTGTPRCLAQAS